MNQIVLSIVAFSGVVFASSAHGEDSDIARLFKEKNVNGSMVISSIDGEKTFTHNDERARVRFLPASTFKIPNTLIALEEAAVADEKEIVVWDGMEKGLPECNGDQTLVTAFSTSCTWFYQEMAKRVGKDNYVSYLGKMKYGNEQVSPEITNFWLEGDLRISALGQVAFLKNIYTRAYPFKSSSYDLLRKLMVVEETPAYTLRAKSGWAQGVSPQVGWFVGYVESGGKVWLFATNMEIVRPEESTLRREVTVEALKLKGII